jgi:hypothetical protein
MLRYDILYLISNAGHYEVLYTSGVECKNLQEINTESPCSDSAK